MAKDRAGLYVVSVFLIVAGLFLSVGSLIEPVSQTLFGSAAVLRGLCLSYSLGMLLAGVLLLSRPKSGCLVAVIVIALASVVILAGLNGPTWYRVVTGVWGLLCAGFGLFWRSRLPVR